MLKPTNMEQKTAEEINDFLYTRGIDSDTTIGIEGDYSLVDLLRDYAAPLRTEIERLKPFEPVVIAQEEWEKMSVEEKDKYSESPDAWVAWLGVRTSIREVSGAYVKIALSRFSQMQSERQNKEIERLRDGIETLLGDHYFIHGSVDYREDKLKALLTPSEKGMKPEETEVCESCGNPHITESMVNEPENANWFCHGCVNEMTEKGGRK